MNPEWLCFVNGQEYGPYTWPQLVQMAAAGNVVPQSYVRRNFDSQWYLAEQVPGLFAPAGAPRPKQAAHPTTPPRTAAASGISTKKPAAKSGTHPVVAAKPAAAPAAPVAAMTPAPAPPLPPEYALPQPAAQAIQPAVPKGRAVSSKPAATVATEDTKPHWIPVNPTAVSPASPAVALKSHAGDGEVAAPAKKDNTKTMVLALGGAICAVAILGGAAVIWKMNQKPEEPKEVAAKPVEISSTESDPDSIAAESNPAAEANPPGPVVTTQPATKVAATPAKTDTAGTTQATAPTVSPAAAALLKSVKSWKPIERFGSVGAKGGLTCIKMTAYLAADAAGRKVTVRAQGAPAANPAGEAAPENGTAASVAPNAEGTVTEPPAIAAPLPAAGGPTKFVSAEAAPYLFVEMTIKNSDTKPLVYSGWNNAATAAVLVDAAGKPLELVAPTATPNVTRPISKEVPPGGTVQDTLVFALPPAGDLGFKLALPGKAFSANLASTWGYEISGSALATAAGGAQIAGADPANPQAAPLVPRSSTSIPIPGLHDPQPPQPAPQPAPEKPVDMPEPEKKPMPTERIPIPGLTDEPENKPAGPKKPEEVPNLAPPKK